MESYKSLRTNISFVMGVNKSKVLLITSANACETKSTTVSNLAMTLAEDDRKVLLIDADMRKPMQHMIYNRPNKHGLSDVIAGMKRLDEVLYRNVAPALDLLSAGTQSPNPSELLGSAMMEELLVQVCGRYDMILIDTPPVNLVTDAISLTNYVPDVLLTVRHEQTRTRDLEEALSKLRLVNGHIIGIVFTCWKEKRKKHHTAYYTRLTANTEKKMHGPK